jgi:alcohol dehydrogenase (cytochrome c)
MTTKIARVLATTVLVALTGWSITVAAQQVSSQDVLDGLKDPGRWLTYAGDYSGRRNSPLTQVTPANVNQLTAQWTFQTGVLGKFEATPIVLDGIIYITGPDNTAWALDARTGRSIWRHQRNLPDMADLNVCCGMVNRGFAVYRDLLVMTTLDAHLVALDMKTGGIVYDVVIDDYKRGYAATVAPLLVKDKVIIGIAGAEFGIRGFIDAYDAATGKRAWRFWTVAAPGEPGGNTWAGDSWERGGGSTWVTGTYDPELNLVYWGTGNPGPDYYGKERPGDNLYTDAVVALDADTGQLRWHYQFTAHDTHDWDAVQVPVLADIQMGGERRKVVMVANRNGFFYTLDRTNGKFLVGRPFVRTTWAERIGADGRPVVLPNTEPTENGTYVCPDITGGTNFMSPSFNPTTGLFYVTAREQCATYFGWDQEFVLGERFTAGGGQRDPGREGRGYGAMRAIDPATGQVAWEFRYQTPSMAGTLSTASGLVFGGDMDGNIMAFDGRSGKNLWHYQTGSGLYSAPTTYMLDGRQYLLVPSGTALTAFALPQR